MWFTQTVNTPVYYTEKNIQNVFCYLGNVKGASIRALYCLKIYDKSYLDKFKLVMRGQVENTTKYHLIKMNTDFDHALSR